MASQAGNILMLSTGLFYIVHVHTLLIKKIGAVFIIGGFYGYLFYITFLGQQIIDSSGGIFDAVYSSDWQYLGPKDRRTLIIVLAKSRQPYVLSMGKISLLSMESFARLTKMVSTYFTALVQLM